LLISSPIRSLDGGTLLLPEFFGGCGSHTLTASHASLCSGQAEIEDRFGDSLERMTAVIDRHSAYFALHFLNHPGVSGTSVSRMSVSQ
ncbi:MAG: hypothetical protein K2J52_05335, partial [Duncaniella sp.]|nr:hypothetical protein [Duncaniella sp.]